MKKKAKPAAAPESRPILGYHIENGVVSIDEVREQLGLAANDPAESLRLRGLKEKLTVRQGRHRDGDRPVEAARMAALDPAELAAIEVGAAPLHRRPASGPTCSAGSIRSSEPWNPAMLKSDPSRDELALLVGLTLILELDEPTPTLSRKALRDPGHGTRGNKPPDPQGEAENLADGSPPEPDAVPKVPAAGDAKNTYDLPQGEPLAALVRKWMKYQQKTVLAKIPEAKLAPLPAELPTLTDWSDPMSVAFTPYLSAEWSKSGEGRPPV